MNGVTETHRGDSQGGTMLTTVHRSLSAPLYITLYILACASYVNGFTFGGCNLHEPKDNQTKFLCDHKQLQKVPQDLPVGVTIIDLSSNNIPAIKRGDFQNLVHLEILNISHNYISHVDREAFINLSSLTRLDLSRNRLREITDGFFSGLTNLQLLRMEFNGNLTIAPSAFSVFAKLEYVQLSGNNLSNIASVRPIFHIETLKKIHIALNNISHFQSTLISNSSLKLQMLNLSSNPISIFRITANIFPNLTEIDLSFCFSKPVKWEVPSTDFLGNVRWLDLSSADDKFKDFNIILQTFNKSLAHLQLTHMHSVENIIRSVCLLPRLTELTLRDNSITSFTATQLDKCSHLRSLDLFHNYLAKLETLFTSLKNLTFLDLSHNNFSGIPNIIQNLSMLETLNVVFNRISRMGCFTFENLNNLKFLNLRNNIISEINSCVFENLGDLKELNLGSNYIGSLRGAFKNGPRNLETLWMGGNSLRSIAAVDFKGLTSLTYLVLNDNKIQSISAGAFDSLISLKSLDLQTNKIADKYINPSVFSGLSNLEELYLQNNHLFKTKRYKKTPFSNLTSLRILSVLSQPHYKTDTFLPVNLLWNLANLTGFWAQNIGIVSLYGVDIFKDNTLLIELALSGNYITCLSPDIFLPLRQLAQLYLKDTALKTLDFIVQAKLHHLRHLQISYNQISSMNETVIKALPALRLLDMVGNTFTCDCSNEWFIKWVKTDNLTQVLAANKFSCNSPPNLKGTELLKLDVHSCSVDIGFYCYISSASVVMLTMLTSLLYHFLRWQIVYAYYLLLAFLYDKKKQKKSGRFQYDAFVSYNIHDEHWVTDTLLPKLEGEQGWRLCLHHRDFQPGKFIVDNIIEGIYGSRKTICVISQHYLESEWCSREVQVASFRLFDEKKDVLILVFLEDIPGYRLSLHYRMRGLVRKRTYLSWPKAGEDKRAFWEKLRLALGTHQDRTEIGSLNDVQNVLD